MGDGVEHGRAGGRWRRLAVAAIRWQATALGEEVLRQSADALAALLGCQGQPGQDGEPGPGALVKSNPLRRVYRLAVAGVEGCGEVFLKEFDESAAIGRLKRLVRGPAGRAEWETLRRAEGGGVAVPPPLAFGAGRDASFLLTASCQPADNLDAWLSGHPWQEQASELLADLLLSAHAAGLLHDDLHAGNILYRHRSGDGPPRMWLLDLQKARFRGPLSSAAIVANLAPLAAGLAAWLSGEQLEQLLRDYRGRAEARSPGVLEGPDRFVAAVRASAARHDARLIRSRVRAIPRTGRYFARIRLPGGWAGHVFLRHRRQQAPPGSIAATARFLVEDWRAALAEVVAEGQPTARTLQVGPNRLEVSIAWFPGPAGLAGLAYWFRRGPATVAFRTGHAVLIRRASVWRSWQAGRSGQADQLGQAGPPLPLACLERRAGGWLRESLLICERPVEPEERHTNGLLRK